MRAPTSGHKKEQDSVLASRPEPFDDERGLSLGGESIREKIVYEANTYGGRKQQHQSPFEERSTSN